jgi:hypothetical protein
MDLLPSGGRRRRGLDRHRALSCWCRRPEIRCAARPQPWHFRRRLFFPAAVWCDEGRVNAS